MPVRFTKRRGKAKWRPSSKVAALQFAVGVHNIIDWRRKRRATTPAPIQKRKPPTRGPDGRWRAAS